MSTTKTSHRLPRRQIDRPMTIDERLSSIELKNTARKDPGPELRLNSLLDAYKGRQLLRAWRDGVRAAVGRVRTFSAVPRRAGSKSSSPSMPASESRIWPPVTLAILHAAKCNHVGLSLIGETDHLRC